MKVKTVRPAFLTDQCGLGGGETSLLNALAGLRNLGVAPLLVCPPGALLEDATRRGFEAVALHFPPVHLRARFLPTFSIITLVRLCGIVLKRSINVIHAESLLGVYYGGITARLCRRSCVATYHGFWRLESPIAHYFLRNFCRRIYPVSATTAAELGGIFAHRPWKLRVIPLDVDGQFAGRLPTRAEARAHHNLPAHCFIILHPARFQRIKAQHIVLEAISRVAALNPTITPLAIFAGAPSEPRTAEVEAYLSEIEARARMPDVKPYVQFIGPSREVAILMRAADVVISPSTFETFGMTVIEALCVGTPVIATSVGGTAELIQHGVDGALIQPDDAHALAAELLDAMAHPEPRKAIAEGARSRALVAYGPGRRAERLIDEYRTLPGLGMPATGAR